jgi:uncharacterized protein (DUF2141 family)
MTTISTQRPSPVLPTATQDAAATPAKPSLTPAKFIDMYRGAIAAAADADGDGRISRAEYAAQVAGAGGSDTDGRWQGLDANGDGKVDDAEFAHTVADPFGNERDALLRRILDELGAGQGAVQPRGQVLDAAGGVADPHATLRWLVATFPGNMQY